MVELLVVIGLIGLLMALLMPSLRGAGTAGRMAKTGNNLRQLGAATDAYLINWKDHLPQVAWEVGEGKKVIIGALFGGKRGTLPFFGIDQIGADQRPLNRYLAPDRFGRDEEVPFFESPFDQGGRIPGIGHIGSMYDAIGTSYVLNDHALQGEAFATLIPSQSPDGRPGGRMPRIADETLTWVIAEHPIYNYQENGNRGHRWYHDQIKTSLWFRDGHVGVGARVPEGIINTTENYTFLPSVGWFD